MPPAWGKSAAVVLGANLLCILLIVLIAVLWRRHEPMTPERLRRTLQRRTAEQQTAPPFDRDLSMNLCVLRDLDLEVREENLFCALLTRWTQAGYIRLAETDKRRFESFGVKRQATLVFLPSATVPAGAEGLLFSMLHQWAGEQGDLQESILYNCSREAHAAVYHRLEQFFAEGTHRLRAYGATYQEAKKRRFGFLDQQRTIYTARGVREAGWLLDYRRFVLETAPANETDQVFAALFGKESQAPESAIQQALARALLDGMRAGESTNLQHP